MIFLQLSPQLGDAALREQQLGERGGERRVERGGEARGERGGEARGERNGTR